MMLEIIELARAKWATWLGLPPPAVIHYACIKGGGAHPSRGIVVLFGDGATEHGVVLKIALSHREAGFLGHEYENLSRLHPAVGLELREGIPKPLAWEALNGAHIMATGSVRGHRIPHPHMPRGPSFLAKRTFETFYRRTFEWSRELSEVNGDGTEGDGAVLADMVHLFAQQFADDSQLERLTSFANHLEEAYCSGWIRGWQHGATDVTNALIWRGDIRFVDWEHASADADPWLDVAYAPLALGRMAVRQSPSRPERAVFSEVLDPDGWIGSRLRSAMEDVWDFPVPIPTAVVLAAMQTALRRERQERPWVADLATGLLMDSRFRSELSWLAPTW